MGTIILLAALTVPNPPLLADTVPEEPEQKCLLWPILDEQGWAASFKIVCE